MDADRAGAVAWAQRSASLDPSLPRSFAGLAAAASAAATALARFAAPPTTLHGIVAGPRIAILAPPSAAAVVAAFGVWRAGGVAVPLHPRDPVPALADALDAAGAVAVVAADDCWDLAVEAAGGRALVRLAGLGGGGGGAPPPSPLSSPTHAALILSTSGTTGRPKPAVHTHASLAAQAASLAAAWRFGAGDAVLNCLPPHHIHGAVVAGLAPLAAGAAVLLEAEFEPGRVWGSLRGVGAAAGDASSPPPAPTIFMGVPAHYARLVAHADSLPAAERARCARAASRLRLAVCGSAALPARVADAWAALAGDRPLERYGSTEGGMLLGQPLACAAARARGGVGAPMPGVSIRVKPDGETLSQGELMARWPGLFAGYWGRPDATVAARDAGGWFRTGDIVSVEEASSLPPNFTILGRASVDVFKVGGEAVSALQVEDALRAHPGVADAAVVGLPTEGAAGAVVAAAVVAADPGADAKQLGGELAALVAARLPRAATPTRVSLVSALPRNAMGKVDKRAVAALEGWVKVRRA
jgi:malonyl-CoA/methylmalonyl-CoA synthetase